MCATILYLDADTGGGLIRVVSLAGMRRYAGSLGWDVAEVPPEEVRREAVSFTVSSLRLDAVT